MTCKTIKLTTDTTPFLNLINIDDNIINIDKIASITIQETGLANTLTAIHNLTKPTISLNIYRVIFSASVYEAIILSGNHRVTGRLASSAIIAS